MEINISLTTDLIVRSEVGPWLGYYALNAETVNSNFTCVVEHTLTTLLDNINTFSTNVVPTRTLITTLVESSIFSGSIVNVNYINTAIPVFADIPTPVAPSDLPHNFTDSGRVVPELFEFYWPYDTLLLTLYAPDFGDAERYKLMSQKKYTRGNKLILFHDVSWGDEKIFEYAFSELVLIEKEVLLGIFRSLLGRKIKIKDHLGISRIGFILTPESEVFQPTRTGYSATFQFQQVG